MGVITVLAWRPEAAAPKAAVDVAPAIARLGTMIVLAPSLVPGLTPPM
jgi:hypothetical protein